MKGVRPCLASDLPDVAALHQRVFHQASGLSTTALSAYMNEGFFGNPWSDPCIPSLVYEDEGRIVGFLGVVPRKMFLKERPIRVAVSSQLIVDPIAHSSGAAFHLQHRLLSGPQNLSLTDGANDVGHRFWETAGGKT